MEVKIADSSGLLTKTLHDGAGRVTDTATSIDPSESDWADALTLTGDTVIKQSHTIYDKAGNAVASLTFHRYGDDTTTTGPLDGSDNYRNASLIWYDAANRPTTSANFGTDPNNFDLLGRTTAVINNYTDGVASETETDTDQITQYIYDTAGRLSVQRALNPLGTGNGVQNQDTTYLYESAISGSLVTSTIYPDSTDTDSTGTDQVKVTYDRLGRQLTTTDQRGVTHTYTYDAAGRLQSDAVPVMIPTEASSVWPVEPTGAV